MQDIVEEMTIVKPRVRRRGDEQDSGMLDLRFNMSGYLP